jgi:transposase, IS30 family
MNKYSRVSYWDRCQISALLKRDFSIPEIATELGFHKSTIYREIDRNKEHVGQSRYKIYHPQIANKKSAVRAKQRGRKSIIDEDLMGVITSKLNLSWSPQAIAGRYFKEKKKSISHQTIYNFIYRNPQYKTKLRFAKKRGVGRYKQQIARSKSLNSIHERPVSASNRSRFGHWERDGMYGANRKQLLICLERKSRLVRIGKMTTVNAREVSKMTEELLDKEKVLSITNDNGTEFRKPETCKYPIYYCDPMKPNQRGSVENVIGSLRKYIKRSTDVEILNDQDIKDIENTINNTPRKMFDYQTPFEVYYKKKVALIV